jgi:hypothetical protein
VGILRSRVGKLALGGVVAAGLIGGGAAIAATEFSSPSQRDSAIISDAASQLGVQPSALSGALTKAVEDQINAEVSAGQISQAQATAIEARIAAGQAPLFAGVGGGFGRGFGGGGFAGALGGGDLSAASTYLGLTTAQIQTDLQGGQTLAQIATAQGKTADGLVQALVTADESKLDSAVAAGTLTSAQEQTIETNLQQQITNRVNGTGPAGGSFGGRLGGPGPGGGGFGFRRGGGPGSWGPGGPAGASAPSATTTD